MLGHLSGTVVLLAKRLLDFWLLQNFFDDRVVGMDAELREGLDSVLSFLAADCASKEGLSLREVAATRPAQAVERLPLSTSEDGSNSTPNRPFLHMPAPLGKCTGCGCDAEADAKGAPRLHPQLAVLLCENCLDRDTRTFNVDVCSTTALCYNYGNLNCLGTLHAFMIQRYAHRVHWLLCRKMATRYSVAGAEWAEIWSAATAASTRTARVASSATSATSTWTR